MPEHIGTWHILAWTYISLEDYPQALATFEKSYQLDRTFGETHGGLAVAHALLGDSQKADRHIKLAEKIAPDSFSVIYAKMVRLTQQGKTKEANALLEHTKDTQYDIFETLPRTLIDNRMNALKNTNTLRKV
jgi:Flp pilus assembly protein TadD